MPLSDEELLKLRLDYAWKYFDFHAKQRVSMFNYFLLVTGIFANAYVVVLKEGIVHVACALAALGAVASLGFILLEIRNRVLVHMGQDVLRKLELDTLFPSGYTGKTSRGGDIQLGFLGREAQERTGCALSGLYKHRFVIRVLEGVVFGCFVAAAVLPHRLPDMFSSASSSEVIQLKAEVAKLRSQLLVVREQEPKPDVMKPEPKRAADASTSPPVPPPTSAPKPPGPKKQE